MANEITKTRIEGGSWSPGNAEALGLGILGIYRLPPISYALMNDGQVVVRYLEEEDLNFRVFLDARNDAKTSGKPKNIKGKVTGVRRNHPVLQYRVIPPFSNRS